MNFDGASQSCFPSPGVSGSTGRNTYPLVGEDTVPFVGVGDNGKTRRNFLFRLVVNVAVIFTSTHTSVGVIALDESFTPDGVSKRIHVFGHRFPLGRLLGPEPLRHCIHVKRGMGGYKAPSSTHLSYNCAHSCPSELEGFCPCCSAVKR